MMKAAILTFLAASVSVFGGTLPLTGSNSTVTFLPGSPNTLTFEENEIFGSFTAATLSVSWDISGGTFDYIGSPASITSGNPANFLLSADSGADSITGVITLASVTEVGPYSAVIAGVLTIGTVGFGSLPADLALEGLLNTDVGAITEGETFALTISVVNCHDISSAAACISAPTNPIDPTGGVGTVGLTPSVPEPGTAGLLGVGLGAVLFAKRRLTGRVI